MCEYLLCFTAASWSLLVLFSQGCGQIMSWNDGMVCYHQKEWPQTVVLLSHLFLFVSVPVMHTHLSFCPLTGVECCLPVRNWAPQEQLPSPSEQDWGENSEMKSEKLVHLKNYLNPLTRVRQALVRGLAEKQGRKRFTEGLSSAGSCTSTSSSVLSSWGFLSSQYLLSMFLLALVEFNHWDLDLD